MAVSQKVDLQFSNKDWQMQQGDIENATKVNKPTWCPGCGDFGVLSATRKALVALQIDPKDTVVVSGIGCSSNFPHFIGGYGIHTLHGRIGPNLTGIKLANPNLTVIGAGGDGDGLGIGLGGFVHSARRNLNVTYVVMDNQIYGLTTGQASPTSKLDQKTKSTPDGNIEHPLNPMAIALSAGATFVARAFSGDGKQFAKIMEAAIAHEGYAFIDALSPCVTFNKVNTYDYFKERVYDLQEEGHDTSDLDAAYKKAYEWDTIDKVPTGIFYQTQKPTYESMEPVYKKFGNPIERGAVRPVDRSPLVDHLY